MNKNARVLNCRPTNQARESFVQQTETNPQANNHTPQAVHCLRLQPRAHSSKFQLLLSIYRKKFPVCSIQHFIGQIVIIPVIKVALCFDLNLFYHTYYTARSIAELD